MSNPWELGWEAIGTIFGILAFIGFVVIEWEKIKKSQATWKISGFVLFILYGMIIGYSIVQSIVWRLVGVILSVVFGALLGSSLCVYNK